MPAVTRRSYSGNAVTTTISGSISAAATSITITDSTGWPDGSTGPFFAVLDEGLSTEESILITSRSGTTLNAIARGQNNTPAVAHSGNAPIKHVFTKTDADEANKHAADTAQAELDHSTLLNNTRHDSSARHTPGTVIPAASTAADLTGSASAPGADAAFSRGGHVHVFPALTAYTPTWTGSGGNPSIGNGAIGGRYLHVGKMLFVRIQVTMGSTTAFGAGAWSFSLPASLSANVAPPGQFAEQVLSAAITVGLKPIPARARTGGTTLQVYAADDSPAAVQMALVSGTVPQAWNNGDTLQIEGWIEVA